MAIAPIKHSRTAARLMVVGFIVAVVGPELAAGPFAVVATFGAGLFLLGLGDDREEPISASSHFWTSSARNFSSACGRSSERCCRKNRVILELHPAD